MSDLFYNIQASSVFHAFTKAVQTQETLDKLEVWSVICILGKAVNKMDILRYQLPEHAERVEEYISLDRRATSLRRINPSVQKLGSVQLLKSIQRCRHFVQRILEETIQELSYQGTFYYLQYVLCCENLTNFDNIFLKRENMDIKDLILVLKEKITVVRRNFEKTQTYLLEMTGPCLERAIANALVWTQTAERHTEVDQQAKLDLNQYNLKQREDGIHNELDKYNSESVEENKIALEIENHLLTLTSKLQNKLENWTVRYNEEIETLDVALLQIKSKLDDKKEQHVTLLAEYSFRQEAIKYMQEESDERERELEIKYAQHKAASKIQRWWRAILFWRFLKGKRVLKRKAQNKKKKK